VLAKELATLDLISNGRLLVGLGAGWMKADYDATGIQYDPPGTRVERLMEAVTVLKGLFADGPVTFQGRHYRISQLEGLPKPLRRPHPPIMIGGGGRRVLSFAAREADIVGVHEQFRTGGITSPWPPDRRAEGVDEKIGWIRDAAGPRFDDLELSVMCGIVAITDDRDRVARELSGQLGVPEDELLASPYALIGTVNEIADTLQRRRDRFHISFIIHPPEAKTYPTASVDAFAPIVERLSGR
jgi:probable F420-dependent oxidoreductase